MPEDFSAIGANPPPVVPDSQATKEQEMLEGATPKHVRREVHRIVIYALRVGAVLLGILLTIRFWHLAGPSMCRWLSDTDIQSIDKMLFSSAFGGAVISYIQSILAGPKEEPRN